MRRLLTFAAPYAAAVAALTLGLAGQPATAQVSGTPAEDQGLGLRYGVWLLEPEIETGVRFDDNIFRDESGATGSLILTAAPSASLSSDWRRHSLTLSAAAETGVFTNSPDDDYLDGSLRFEGVLDATRATRLRLRAGAARAHEARGGDDADFGLAEPVDFAALDLDLTGQYAPGRLRIQPMIGVERFYFHDATLLGGGAADQDDRDRTVLRAALLAGWRWTPGVEVFGEARLVWTDFDNPLDRGGLDRDGMGAAALVGVKLGVTRLIEGSAAAGVAHRGYDDPALRGFTGPVVEIGAAWSPSRLVTLEATASRRIEETTVAPASGADVAAAGLSALWAVRRFVDLRAEAAFERRRFRGAGRTDETIRFGLGADWRLRRDATLRAGYVRIRERSDAPGEDNDVNQAYLGLRYRF